MIIISFAYTAAAFEAGMKNCTRRYWPDRYAAQFKVGMVCQGWDRGARNGGQTKGLLLLVVTPYKENTRNAPEEDYDNEGLAWMEKQGLMVQGKHPRQFWDEWRAAGEDVTVVRFKKIEKPEGLFYPGIDMTH
jgi:hypothetical protein